MVKEIRWQKKSDGKRNRMVKEIRWQKKSDGKRNQMAKEIRWPKKSNGKRNQMAKKIQMARERRKVKLAMVTRPPPPAATFAQSCKRICDQKLS